MTISGIIICSLFTLLAVTFSATFASSAIGKKAWVIGIILIVGIWVGGIWYTNGTASGRRSLIDQRAELNNGLDRTINIYTANGDLIATYTGKIDLEDNEGGYVLFDWEGKRYTYYNCFVESIAVIE